MRCHRADLVVGDEIRSPFMKPASQAAPRAGVRAVFVLLPASVRARRMSLRGNAVALAPTPGLPEVDYPRRGRPPLYMRLVELIEQMARVNPGWGYRRIQGELR
jgi:putative transposase